MTVGSLPFKGARGFTTVSSPCVGIAVAMLGWFCNRQWL